MRPTLVWALGPLACAPGTVEVVGNGAFATDGGSGVLVASVTRRTRAGAPWYADPSARDWHTVFSVADQDLGAGVEVARVAEVGAGQGGGILSAQLWWLSEAQRAVALESHQAVVYDLSTGRRAVLELPDDALAERFVLPDIDLRGDVGPMALAPSPDGQSVAVHWQAALLPEGALGEMVFFHAVGFFELSGALISSNTLDLFAGGASQLRRASPAPEPAYPSPPPPAHQPLNTVPAHHVVSFVWAPDSASVVFVGVPADGTSQAVALAVPRDGGAAERIATAPSPGLPAPGGPVDDATGDFLLVREPEGDPDGLSLERWAGGAHNAYGAQGLVAPDAVGFTW